MEHFGVEKCVTASKRLLTGTDCTVPQSVEQKEKYGLKYTLKSEVVSKKKLLVVTEV